MYLANGHHTNTALSAIVHDFVLKYHVGFLRSMFCVFYENMFVGLLFEKRVNDYFILIIIAN